MESKYSQFQPRRKGPTDQSLLEPKQQSQGQVGVWAHRGIRPTRHRRGLVSHAGYSCRHRQREPI
eukprot:10096984-Alexandrium_andersonii.AAC.1